MYKVSELAQQVGLSRTALLYYEKKGLISGRRLDNGYRVYTQKDLQRVRLIQQLLAGGLTLRECKACIESKIDQQVLRRRLTALDDEIKIKQQSRNLLSAMLGEGELKTWHEQLNKVAPDAHLDWLIKQGFEEKEALRLRWLSKDMHEHDRYMTDFMTVYNALEQWGPGSTQDTLKALKAVPPPVCEILEIGCGKGLATQVLAQHTPANITAIDNEQSALDALVNRFKQTNLLGRLSLQCLSMTQLHTLEKRFDLLWAEGSAYIMGVTHALNTWAPLLTPRGTLVFSDLVWHTSSPSNQAKDFWSKEYADMQPLANRLRQIEQSGFNVITHFSQSNQAWLNYYQPLEKRVQTLKPSMPFSAALNDLEAEINVCTQFAHEFGYHFFIVEKKA
ncbi:MerR family transcriptional regulator [Pseudoalteromonas sp. SMS1]|uniref:MerR family transcriptional regulator n=1 Tax=Pseudoalteromonas sp. SMS1 TaxID=2908894 RepID=UPI001F2F6391|nr:MerR family transcriptional regulator [Pseudoalteromonas sp. SMS1]MCF2859994.1 MerR family transcriptional regulator [Pseudoalteromonas sp. SMS1]